MINLNDILIPVDDRGYHLGNTNQGNSNHAPSPVKTNWESDWGFRVVADLPHRIVRSNIGWSQSHEIGGCILELATAANCVGDYQYWIASRVCLEKFVETLTGFANPNFGSEIDYIKTGPAGSIFCKALSMRTMLRLKKNSTLDIVI